MKATDSCLAGQIKGFFETSFIDWFGKISSVIFLSGCNLRCPYCHNHPLVLRSHSVPTLPREWIAGRLQEFADWIDGVVISGGEPCLYPQLPQLIKFFRDMSFPVKLDTNGTKPDVLARLLDEHLIDYVAMDMKAPLDDIRYSRCAGVPLRVAPIQRSLSILAEGKVEYELRMTVCPSLTREKDIHDLARQMDGVPRFVLQGFSPKDPLNPALKNVTPYSQDQMMKFKEILEEHVAECRLVVV
jgi:pyruvate formate lyase activating enzyme